MRILEEMNGDIKNLTTLNKVTVGRFSIGMRRTKAVLKKVSARYQEVSEI